MSVFIRTSYKTVVNSRNSDLDQYAHTIQVSNLTQRFLGFLIV